MSVTSSSLLESLRRNRLLESEQLAEAESLSIQINNPSELVGRLQDRGWLSSYQVETVLKGKADSLILGPYVLLECVGEGGMGQVFKAVHRILKSVRAVKIIRDECLTNKLSIERFFREIELVSRLNHPNIVLAHDAGQHNDTHYFVMEFVSGVDLSKLLRQRGPLPVSAACECIRQTALGLHHAFERGLVHRDIKPSNLLLNREDGLVKILDMGLARLRDAPGGSAGSSADSPLTPSGAVMGTPDYMAPEQAEDSRQVDTRADIYSLGCSLYQLLTGQLPFPGGSYVEKLIKHRFENPTPIDQFRADVPQEVAVAVFRMMAKSPADRYATPGEVAQVLRPWSRPLDLQSLLYGDGDSSGAPATHRLEADSLSQVPDTLNNSRLLNPSVLASDLAPTFNRSQVSRIDSRTDILDNKRPAASEDKTIPPPPSASLSPTPPVQRSRLVYIVPFVLGLLLAGVFGAIVMLKQQGNTTQPTTNPLAQGESPKSTGSQATGQTPTLGPPPPLGTTKANKPTQDIARTGLGQNETRERLLPHLQDFYTLKEDPPIHRLVFSGDGTRMALNLGEYVQIVETATGKTLQTLAVKSLLQHPGNVVRKADALALSNDGKALLFATTSQPTNEMIDKGANKAQDFDVLVLWQEGKAVNIFYRGSARYIDKVPFPTSKLLKFVGRDTRFALAGRQEEVILWDLNSTRSPYGTLPYREADGCFAATNDGSYALIAPSGLPLALCPLKQDAARAVALLKGHQGTVTAVAISEGSQLILAGDSSGQLSGWLWPDLSSATESKPREVLPAWSGKAWGKESIEQLAISPLKDNPLFATSDAQQQITLGRAVLEERTMRVERLLTEPLPRGEIIQGMTFAPDGQSVWVATSRRIARLWLKPQGPTETSKPGTEQAVGTAK